MPPLAYLLLYANPCCNIAASAAVRVHRPKNIAYTVAHNNAELHIRLCICHILTDSNNLCTTVTRNKYGSMEVIYVLAYLF